MNKYLRYIFVTFFILIGLTSVFWGWLIFAFFPLFVIIFSPIALVMMLVSMIVGKKVKHIKVIATETKDKFIEKEIPSVNLNKNNHDQNFSIA
ncbi:MAG: hypothetical protein WA160_10915 [Pseudobdellovibrio sp.]